MKALLPFMVDCASTVRFHCRILVSLAQFRDTLLIVRGWVDSSPRAAQERPYREP